MNRFRDWKSRWRTKLGAGGQGPGEEAFKIRRPSVHLDLQARIAIQKSPDEITALPFP